MNPIRSGLPHAGTGRSPNRGRVKAARSAPGRVDRVDGVPDALVTAIHAAEADKDIPAQGFPALRDHVTAGAPRPDDLELSNWLACQSKAQSLVEELIERLPAATPGHIPAHHLEWWFTILPYPWAEDLVVAVTYGFVEVA